MYSGEQADILKNNLPEYRWLKNDPRAGDMRMALRVMADSMLDQGGASHAAHAQTVIGTMIAAGRAVTPTEAAELQMALGIAMTAAGTMDWPRVIIAELAVAAARSVPQGTMHRIKAARCTLPDAPMCAIGALANLPIGAVQKKQEEMPRPCRTCGKKFTGVWTAEKCKAGHPKN